MNFDPLGWNTLYNAGTHVYTPPAGCYRVSADVTYKDTAAEDCQSVLAFWLNGTIYPFAGSQATCSYTVLANGYQSLHLSAVIPFNGTDTLEVIGRMSGAAGTLSLQNISFVVNLA